MGTIGKRRGFALAAGMTTIVVALTTGPVAASEPDHPASDCGTYSGRGCAAPSRRVDLSVPRFSHPTQITNPLFPISRLRSVVLLGRVGREQFRSETTLLPGAARVAWNGRRIRVLLSQYMAFRNGRLEEVALDRYAQADDGSVWYLGEDVFDYRDGTVAATEGTWLAGREGPPAMIMPARPRVGDVFRPENVPGVVFEEVTVTSTDATVAGPRGAVENAMVASELHLDGSRSKKVFAPGYGEFLTRDGEDVEALALATPSDGLAGPPPLELRFLVTGAFGALESMRVGDWIAARSTAKRIRETWSTMAGDAPPLIRPRLATAVGRLGGAVQARSATRASRLAIEVARLALDLELRYSSVLDVDIERFHLWTQQLRVHASSADLGGVRGDVAVLEWMRDRIVRALSQEQLRRLDAGLRALRTAADARSFESSADHAARLGALVRRFAMS